MPLEVLTPEGSAAPGSGLRHNILSPLETLSQSISAIAPTTSPALTVPLVFALAGNGAWLAYLIAGAGMLLVALCIARFARTSSSPGSLYKYATDSLPPVCGAMAGGALLLAYVATGSSVVGGFINYARVLVPITQQVPASLLALIVTVASTALAYRDIQTSTRLMLWIEAASISMITIVLAILLVHNGFHLDMPQLTLQHITPSGVRLGVVLAIFSFVGFESATTLGHEARNPLRTIPRAVVQSAVLCCLFFLIGTYTETLAFRQIHNDLGASTAPFTVLAPLAHIPLFSPLIATGTFISMFACTLACITAGARVLLKMAHDGLAPSPLGRTHPSNETPHVAVLTTGLAVLIPAVLLSAHGVSGADIYAWMGSLAVYGFLTVYLLVVVALPLYLRRNAQLTPAALALSIAAGTAMILAIAGTVYPVPTERPYNHLPYFYLAYLALGLAVSQLTARSKKPR